jgi:hypothetical protein
MGKITARPHQGIVIVHVGNVVVFGEGFAHLGRQLVERRIPDAQNVGTGRFQLAAELVVMVGKMGG